MIPTFAVTSRSEPAAPPRLQRTDGAARIAFKLGGGATRLDRLYQSGAAKIRLPRGPVGEPPEAVLINTAGGLTGGDRMEAAIDVAAFCRATISTQACEKVYRASSGRAEIRNSIDVGAGARLDWLPQETILFDGAQLSRQFDVTLAEGATLLAAESVIFGRQAHGESVRSGRFTDRWRIRRGEKLVFADDLRFDWADAELLSRPATLAGGRAMATLLLVGDDAEQHLEPLRAVVGEAGGVSAWGGKLLARLVAADGVALRETLIPAIGALRGGLPLPRIWRI